MDQSHARWSVKDDTSSLPKLYFLGICSVSMINAPILYCCHLAKPVGTSPVCLMKSFVWATITDNEIPDRVKWSNQLRRLKTKGRGEERRGLRKVWSVRALSRLIALSGLRVSNYSCYLSDICSWCLWIVFLLRAAGLLQCFCHVFIGVTLTTINTSFTISRSLSPWLFFALHTVHFSNPPSPKSPAVLSILLTAHLFFLCSCHWISSLPWLRQHAYKMRKEGSVAEASKAAVRPLVGQGKAVRL